MILAHKIALHPNNKQRTYFVRTCGVARFAYNLALDTWQKQFKAHKENPELPKPNEVELSKLFSDVLPVLKDGASSNERFTSETENVFRGIDITVV